MAKQLDACPTSKAVLLSYAAASKAAKRASRFHEKAFCAYRCPQCGGWHVGSHFTNSRPQGPLPILETNHQAFLGAIMNYDNPDLDAPAIDWAESQAEAAACQQIEYDQQQQQAEALPF